MSKLIELQQKLGSIVEQQREINDRSVDGDFANSEDRATYERLDSEFDRLKSAVDREKSLQERELGRFQGQARATSYTEEDRMKSYRKWMAYGDQLPNEDREVLAHFAAQNRESQASSPAASGGQLIPTLLYNQIETALKAFGGVYSIAGKLGTANGAPIEYPTLDDTANLGGIIAENAEITGATKLTFGKVDFGAYMYTSGWITVPNSLIQDSAFDINGLVASAVGERVGRAQAAHFVTGTGTGQPQGIVTGASAGITAAAAAITADNILDLLHSIDPAYRTSSAFGLMMNDATMKAVRKLKNNDGDYIWSMGDIRTNAPATIWGAPVYVDNGFANIGASAVSMIAGDFNKYIVRDVTGARLVRTTERFVEFDQVGFVFLQRRDARVIQPSAIKKLTHAAS
jgi:HK97 family phage major capsid protein